MPKSAPNITDMHHRIDEHWQHLRAKYRQEHGPEAMEAAERVINDPWIATLARHAFDGIENSDDSLMNWFLRELWQLQPA